MRRTVLVNLAFGLGLLVWPVMRLWVDVAEKLLCQPQPTTQPQGSFPAPAHEDLVVIEESDPRFTTFYTLDAWRQHQLWKITVGALDGGPRPPSYHQGLPKNCYYVDAGVVCEGAER